MTCNIPAILHGLIIYLSSFEWWIASSNAKAFLNSNSTKGRTRHLKRFHSVYRGMMDAGLMEPSRQKTVATQMIFHHNCSSTYFCLVFYYCVCCKFAIVVQILQSGIQGRLAEFFLEMLSWALSFLAHDFLINRPTFSTKDVFWPILYAWCIIQYDW